MCSYREQLSALENEIKYQVYCPSQGAPSSVFQMLVKKLQTEIDLQKENVTNT